MAAEIRERKLIKKYNELKVYFIPWNIDFDSFLFLKIKYLSLLLASFISLLDSQEGGKLDAYIEKRRKKNASKDHRYVPYKRPSNGGQQ